MGKRKRKDEEDFKEIRNEKDEKVGKILRKSRTKVSIKKEVKKYREVHDDKDKRKETDENRKLKFAGKDHLKIEIYRPSVRDETRRRSRSRTRKETQSSRSKPRTLHSHSKHCIGINIQSLATCNKCSSSVKISRDKSPSFKSKSKPRTRSLQGIKEIKSEPTVKKESFSDSKKVADKIRTAVDQTKIEKKDNFKTVYDGKLPSWKHSWFGEVIHVEDISRCGLIRLSPINGFSVYCLFSALNFWPKISAEEPFSKCVLVGHQFKVNIKLVNSNNKIPYMATNVWPGQVDVPPNIQAKLQTPIQATLLTVYDMFTPSLVHLVPSSSVSKPTSLGCTVFCPFSTCGIILNNVLMFWQHVVDLHLRAEVLEEMTAKHIENEHYHCPFTSCSYIFNFESLSNDAQSELVIEHLKVDHFDVFSSKLETRFPIFCKENSSFIQSFRRIESDASMLRSRQVGSIERNNCYQIQSIGSTLRLDKNMNNIQTEKDYFREVFTGKEAIILQYLDETSGIMEIGKWKAPMLFSISQIWLLHPVIGLHRFEELYCQKDLMKMIPIGTKIVCRARAIKTLGIKLQATAVWMSQIDPRNYQEVYSIEQLNLQVEKYMFQVFQITPSKESLICHPLLHPDFIQAPLQGIVQEHINSKSGLIKLFSEDSVVLFCLHQLRIKNAGSNDFTNIELSSDSDKILKNLLPIGCVVTVYVRRIPAHTYSQLRYQAVFLMKGIYNNSPHLEVYLGLELGSVENIYQTMSKLDDSHEAFKKSARLYLNSSRELSMVAVALDCLPQNWEASVVLGLNSEIGIIQINKSDGSDISIPGQVTTTRFLFALFHISDVIISPHFKGLLKPIISSIIGTKVDLRARNITLFERPSEVLVEIRKIAQHSGSDSILTLQAVHVFVKHSADEKIPKDVSRPTVLRSSPGSFNSNTKTPFFCSETLRFNLNQKVGDFLKLETAISARNVLVRNYYENLLTNPVNGTVRYAKGRVIKILSENYGVGTVFKVKGERGPEHAEVLFDIYDVWVGSTVCATAGISLKELLKPGDYIKFLCLPVEREQVNSLDWNVRFLATSVVSSLNLADLEYVILPSTEVHKIEDVCQEKLRNFHSVVRYIEKSDMSSAEKLVLQEVEFNYKLGRNFYVPIELECEKTVVWKKGYVLVLVDDEFGIIRFEKKVGAFYKTCHAIFHRQSVYRNIDYPVPPELAEGKLRLFLKPGYPVRFNGFRIRRDENEIVDFFASSVNFGALTNRELHDYELYMEKDILNLNIDPILKTCKSYVASGIQSLTNFFCVDSVGVDYLKLIRVEFPKFLTRVESCVIYEGSDFLVFQVDFGSVTVNAVLLSNPNLPGTKDIKLTEFPVSTYTRIDAVLVHPCGGIQYMVTKVLQEADTTVCLSGGADFSFIQDKNLTLALEQFHSILPSVYYLPQIFNGADIESILRPLFPRESARKVISEYYSQIGSGIVFVKNLLNLTDPSLQVTARVIKLLLLYLGYISLCKDGSKSPLNFNGVTITDEFRARFSSAILPISCILQYNSIELSNQFPGSESLPEGWNTEKDFILLREAVTNFFSWRSILSDESFILREEIAETQIRPRQDILSRCLSYLSRTLISPSIHIVEEDCSLE